MNAGLEEIGWLKEYGRENAGAQAGKEMDCKLC